MDRHHSPLYIIGGPNADVIESLIEFLVESKKPLSINLGFKAFEDREGFTPVAITGYEFSKVTPHEKFDRGYDLEGKAILRFGASSPETHAIKIMYSAKTKNGRLYTTV